MHHWFRRHICGRRINLLCMLALGSVMVGKMLDTTGNNLIACVVCIAICTFFGLINGLLLAKFDLFPFVVTLATQLSIRGIGYLISGGYSEGLSNVKFTNIGIGKSFGIPNAVFFLVAILIVTYILMHQTKFGRYDYAIGGNRAAAIASGVPVFWTTVGTYVFSGFCTGVAAVLMSARINAAQPNIGIGYETDAIAACVIGGTSFAGGISTIPGCMNRCSAFSWERIWRMRLQAETYLHPRTPPPLSALPMRLSAERASCLCTATTQGIT